MLDSTDPITIEKNRTLRPSQDYYFLREQGIAFIRDLSGKLWTDHNSHDPGITIMELLCYALTDLGYRTDFKMADLLMEPNNQPFKKSGLFPAHEILTTCPVTIMDYRKLLLKLKDVRNAWLMPRQDFSEVPLFVDCGKGGLTFENLHYKVTNGALAGKILIFNIIDRDKLQFSQNVNLKLHELKSIDFKKSVAGEQHLVFELQYSFWYKKQTVRFEEVYARLEDGTALDQEALVTLMKDTSKEGLLWMYFEQLSAIQLESHLKPIRLNGLYDVLLELEVDNELGALTERALTYRIPFGDLKGVIVKFDFEDQFDFTESLDSFTPSNFVAGNKGINWTFDSALIVEEVEHSISGIRLEIINNKPRSNEAPISVDADNLEDAVLNGTLPNGESIKGLFELFWEKQKRRQQIIDRVCCVLQEHRNLCEDFHAVKTVPFEKVAICVDIETRSDVDLEVLYADIIYAVENYLNPPIKYYTLSELLDEGYTADQIFDGPFVQTDFECGGELAFVKAGFVKSEDIEASALRKVIYASDIINILMDFDGVLTVKNLQLRKYDAAGNTHKTPFKWCLEIEDGHQPVFDLERSKFLFFKNEIPYTAKLTETLDQLNFLRQAGKKAAYVEPNQTLPFPEGRYRNLHEYFPLQNDLPQNYGTGEARLPRNVPKQRLAAAKQLKGYLHFYEQVLADYLAQLAQAKRLLSVDDTLVQTYFSTYLKELTGLEKADAYDKEYYIEGQYDVSVPATYYLENEQLRQSFYESQEAYQERRNRFLDHLLARFGEQFTDYTLMLFSLNGDRLATGEELIGDKIGFLAEFPALSRSRFKAFNYQPEDPNRIWDTDNIAGLKRRIGRLLGIRDLTRRNLHCTEMKETLVKSIPTGAVEQVRFKVSGKANDFFLSRVLPTEEEVTQLRDNIRSIIGQYSAYEIEEIGGRFFIHIVDKESGEKLTYQEDYPLEGDADFRLRQILGTLERHLQSDTNPLNGASPFCGSREKEGFYLFEHILLRPINDLDEEVLMKICPPEDCQLCGDEDPYSFRISIVLPYWPGRFNEMNFRDFFERSIREEVPAHIHVKICWIGNEQMEVLDTAYQNWLILKQQKKPEVSAYNMALKALIDILEQLQTVYPQATLHDCEEDGGDRPVQLGKTGLGIF